MADNYRALTRTYRPQVFEDIVSQEHVSSTLRNAIAQNRLSHAYMFCGPRGVGKTTMARVLARSINQIDETVDGESLSQTLNVVEIDAASNNKVEDIHHLREIVRIPPQSGRYKIFIIDEVHMLSKAAFNALLKTLEEPPPHAIFIFATTEPHKVLPTILSRVQRFDFKRISVDEIVARLQVICKNEGIDIDNESLHTIAKKADGALRDALGLMDQAIAFCGTKIEYKHLIEALNIVGNDQLFEFTKAVSDRDSDTGLKLIDRLLKDGIDIQEFLVSLTGHIRNLYVAKQSERMYLVEATSETKNRYIDTAKIFTENDLMRTLHLVSEAQMKIRDVQQPRVHFEILMLKLIHMGRSKEVHQLLEGLDQLKKKIKNPDPDLKNSEHLRERDQTSEEKSDGVINSESVQTPNSISEGRSSTAIERKGRHSSSDKAESEKRFNDKSSDNGRPHDQNENRLSTTTENNSIENSNDESGSKPDIKSSISESKNHDVATDDDHFMGRPRLGIEKKEQPSEQTQEQDQGQSEENEGSLNGGEAGIGIQLKNIEELEKRWPEYLTILEQKVSKTIYHQIENVQLKDLNGTELILSVNNVFAVNIVEENKNELSELLKEVVGIHIRFKCVVERQKTDKSESTSPYERFKEVQKKDPHLSTIVELFGAEVEY